MWRIEESGLKVVRAKGISDDVLVWMQRRSFAFAEATSRPPGKAMTYGAIKKEPKSWPSR